MREIDTLFEELRSDVVPKAAAGDPGRVIGRARARRARRRIAAAAAVAAVALVLVPLLRDGGREPVRPALTPTAAPTVQQRVLKSWDLLYADEARQGDPLRWTLDGGSSAEFDLPYCGGEPLGGEHLTSAETRLSSHYSGTEDLGDEEHSTSFSEQVVVFPDEDAARAYMAMIIAAVEECGPDVPVSRPAIGDEAITASREDRPDAADPIPGHTEGVAFRQGRVIAVYGNHRNDAAPLKTLTDHENDARTMAAALTAWGY